MKKAKESLRSPSRLAALFFLSVALFCFGFDLYHFTHHLRHDPSLWGMPAVPVKLAWKIVLFSLTSLLLLFFFRISIPVLAAAFLVLQGPSSLEAVMTRADCERARELLRESGIARDAKENFFGQLKISPPRTSFPPEMDKVTWWGTFKPFEFWESPEFQAVWINPYGGEAGRRSFRGGPCALAKTTLRVDELPQRRLEPGMWRVIVTCEDVVIDNHPFAVIGSPTSPDAAKEGGVMIWADDVK